MGKGLSKHLAAIKAMDGKSVSVGWFQENRYPDGKPVASVAAKNEFGGVTNIDGKFVTIPARPLLRTTAEQAAEAIKNITEETAIKVISGNLTPEQALMQVGEVVISTASDVLRSNNFVANAKITEEKKGFNKPLVDTGHLGQSIQAKINYEHSEQ